MRYGMIPEFVGRFPINVELEGLTVEDMTRVLVEPKNNLLAQMQYYFTTDGVELEFEDAAVLAIAQQAIDMGIGARGLKTVLEQVLLPFLYSISELKKNGIKQLTITEEMIITQTQSRETNEV